MKTKSIMLIAVSLGFGLIAAIGMSQVLGKNNAEGEPEVEMVQVFVAKAPIEIGDELTDDNLNVQKQPANFVPETAIRSMEEFNNKIALQKIPKNAMIFAEYIIDKNEASINDRQPPKGWRAFTIKTQTEDSFHNSIQPGDRVDIIGVFRVRDPKYDKEVSVPKTFLKNIEIWKVNDKNKISNKDEENDKVSTITVLLTPDQSEIMLWAEDVTSKTRLVLANRNDAGTEEDEFKLDQFAAMFQQPKDQPKDKEPKTENKKDDSKDDSTNQEKVDPPKNPEEEFAFVMTVYRGGKAVKYGFKDRGSLPVVIKQTEDEDEEKETESNEPENKQKGGKSEGTEVVDDESLENKAGPDSESDDREKDE